MIKNVQTEGKNLEKKEVIINQKHCSSTEDERRAMKAFYIPEDKKSLYIRAIENGAAGYAAKLVLMEVYNDSIAECSNQVCLTYSRVWKDEDGRFVDYVEWSAGETSDQVRLEDILSVLKPKMFYYDKFVRAIVKAFTEILGKPISKNSGAAKGERCLNWEFIVA